jgi:hypothetical protein
MALVLYAGDERDLYRAAGAEHEWTGGARDQHEPPRAIAYCTRCTLGFLSWDEALAHAEYVHGRDRTPEEARALLKRL